MVAMDATELSAYAVQHNPWHASMCNAATAQTVTVGGFVQLTFDTAIVDPSGICNNMGGTGARFLIQQDGVYLICAALMMGTVDDTHRYAVAIFKNGAELVRGLDYSMGAGELAQSPVHALCKLTVNDFIDFRAQNFTTTHGIQVGTGYTWADICWIGPS